MTRIAVLVSGGGTNLQALIDAQGRGELKNGVIAAVISSRADAFALERAARAGIPGYVVSRKDYGSNREMTAALVEQLRGLEIDGYEDPCYCVVETVAKKLQELLARCEEEIPHAE